MSHYDSETGLVKVSWSKILIRTAEECKQKAWLTSEGKSSQVSDVRIFFSGNVVDRAMRQWLSQSDPSPHWMTVHVEEIFDGLEREIADKDEGVLRWRHRDDRRQIRDFCVEAVARLEPILNQLVLPYEYQPALRFKTRLLINGLDGEPTPILLTGEMDVLTREAGKLPDISIDDSPYVQAMDHVNSLPKYRVWDLKVTKDDQYWRKTIAQLVFYDIACICMFGQPTAEVGLIQPMVGVQPWIPFRVSDEDRTFMFNRIEGVAQAILRNDHSPKEGTEGCLYCECRNSCVRYAPEPGTNVIPLF